MKTVAQVLAQTLKRAGIETVFGLPGGENTEVLEAFRQAGLEFILVRNESSAVFMADVTARLTGKPGVCLTTLGPGAANAYCGVSHAFLDRAPVLIITAIANAALGDHTHQVLDLHRIFEPVTKLTCELTAKDTEQTILHALRISHEGRPGPVHLGVRKEVSRQRVLDSGNTSVHLPPAVPEVLPSPDVLQKAKNLLARSRRPVVIVGLGMEPERPYTALQHLAERFHAPVIVTPKGKGSLPDDHPLSAGTIGLTYANPVDEILNEADCILAVGFDVVELVKPWDQEQPLVWIAPWVNNDPMIPAEVQFVGPMGSTLMELATADVPTDPDWGEKRIAMYRRTQAEHTPPRPMEGTLLPQDVLRTIRVEIPRDTLVTTDVGAHKIFASLVWPTYAHNRFMLSNGLSSMGFGLPAAMAAAKELNAPTISITGDGGMAMVLGELGLLKELKLPVIILLMNDNALDLIRSVQLGEGKPVYGTEFNNPDYGLIMSGYGIDHYRVTTVKTCRNAIRKSITNHRPAMIEAMIDPAGYPTHPSQAGT